MGWKQMKIGVARETAAGEARVASTPEVAKKLVGKGFEVVLEAGAGEAAHYPDADYAAAGGVTVGERASAFDVDILLKVRRPSGERKTGVLTCAIGTNQDLLYHGR
jgi:NAD(P) transhydrogenase subunit alpha